MSQAADIPLDLLEHAAFVRRLARTLLVDGQAAEDLEQETWRAALERPPRLSEARGWLARVLRNFARRRWRAEARRATRERDAAREEALPGADAGLEHAETLQRVVDAVRALKEPYRETILLRFYEDLPPRTIATRQGVPVETVHTRLKRGLAGLRTRLAREERDGLLTLGLLAGESPCLPPYKGEVPSRSVWWVVGITVGALAVRSAWPLVWPAKPGRMEVPQTERGPTGSVPPALELGQIPAGSSH